MTMSDYQYPAALPVTTTGGWARPGWWDVVADGEKAGRFGPADRQELLDDYCQLAIYDQEAAGLDALTDGEHRRGGWIEGITGKMAGLALKPTPRWCPRSAPTSRSWWRPGATTSRSRSRSPRRTRPRTGRRRTWLKRSTR